MRVSKRGKWIIVAVMLAVCVALICFTAARERAGARQNILTDAASAAFTPVQRFFTNIFTWCGGKVRFVVALSEMEAENRRLKSEMEALRIEVSRLRSSDEQAAELSALLKVDREYAEYSKVGARVIAKDPGNWYDAFTIDRGKNDNVTKNMVVLAAGGLAGRVTEAGANYAKVITLVNDESAISAKSARTGDTGFVRGDVALMRDGRCKMEYIDQDAEIAIGDEIVTSHLSSVYPPGITIGYVTELAEERGMKTAVVTPTVDFRYMDTVLVITKLFEYNRVESE